MMETQNDAIEIDTVIAEMKRLNKPTLNNLERQTISFLKAIWAAQGKDKEIIDIRASSHRNDRFDRKQ